MKKRFLVLILCLFMPLGFVGCGNPNKDLLSTPKNVSIQADGIVSFERINNDEYYVIKINDLEQNVFVANKNPYMELYNKNGVNYLQYDISRMLSLGESYTIQVKACANKKKDSEFTAPISYVHQVHIDTPKTIITGTTLSWDSVYNANSYIVKVVTPSTVVAADDPETIANATNVFTSQYSLNKFDFSAMLTEAGEYKFYVSAISRDNNYLQSGFSTKVVYENYIDLTTPANLTLHKVDGDWILACVIDNNTNNLKVEFNGENETIDVNASCVERDSECENLIYINLNQALKSKDIEFNTSYAKASCQAVFETTSKNYYISSAWGEAAELKLANKLATPTVALDSKTNIMSWNVTQAVAGFKVFVCTANEVQTCVLSSNNFAIELPLDFVSAAVQALGTGEYANSQLSQFVHNSINQTESLAISLNGNNFEWKELEDHYYIVEIDEEILLLNTNKLNALSVDYQIKEIKVTAIAAGKNSNTAQLKPNYTVKLSTPTNAGFVSSNKYLLTFDKVEKAIGYKVFVTDLSEENNQPISITTIFANNAIDLSSFVSPGKEYRIQIQAIADKYGYYSNSDLTSKDLILTYQQVLDTPTLVKDNLGSPITIKNNGGQKSYAINFNGVTGAAKYEIKIDFQTKTVLDDNRTSTYSIDISEYLTEINGETKAGVHNIAVRALPQESDKITQASKEAKYELTLRNQLKQVTNIQVSDPNKTDGQFILSFDLQDNAKSYSVEIQKLNDTEYITYLASLNLTLPITDVIGAINITDYLLQAGEYYIYMTAHPADKDYYESSDRSSEFAVVSKLQSLATPSNYAYQNQSNKEFFISWAGDENADIYTIKISTPQNKESVFKTTQTSYNISDLLTVEGNYSITVKSVVSSGSESSKTYISSPFSEAFNFVYRKTMLQDFERYGVCLFDDKTKYDYAVNNVTNLTNLLWYHLLYGVDKNYKLPIYIQPNDDENIKQAIVRFAQESSNYVLATGNTSLYNFETDTNWQALIANKNATNANLFGYLSARLLEQYPEMAIVDAFSCEMTNNNIFTLNYSNLLDTDKIKNTTNVALALDFANDYTYIDKSLRRNTNSVFAIDNRKSMDITTTEQLFMAVQYGFKPNFVGESEIAQKVYENAKLVLTAIVTSNMTEVEKATAIFDWLEFAFNINMNSKIITENGVVKTGELKDWGLREEFYLEGLLYNIGQNANGDVIVSTKQATSEAISKAFVLFCNIEGIETRKVNGNLAYKSSSNLTTTMAHSWNKILLSTDEQDEQWYNVDLTYSDLRFDALNHSNSYNMASHLFFLVSDAYLQSNLNFGDKTNALKMTSVTEKQIVTMPSSKIIGKLEANYDYYANTIKNVSFEELQTIFNPNFLTPDASKMSEGLTQADNAPLSLSLKYMADWNYRQYLLSEYETSISRLQSFALNVLVYGKSLMFKNQTKCASFELRVDENNNLDVGSLVVEEIGSNNAGRALYKMNNNYITEQERSNGQYLNVKTFSCYDKATNTTTIVVTMQYEQ